ncbi:MAG: hypothetical protein HOE90_13245 [Bacteriovoracaceae bacterium]|jgi:hypothetical protein|nr:hypothetical protein [Bacteriovoracaceae bacterium]
MKETLLILLLAGLSPLTFASPIQTSVVSNKDVVWIPNAGKACHIACRENETYIAEKGTYTVPSGIDSTYLCRVVVARRGKPGRGTVFGNNYYKNGNTLTPVCLAAGSNGITRMYTKFNCLCVN